MVQAMQQPAELRHGLQRHDVRDGITEAGRALGAADSIGKAASARYDDDAARSPQLAQPAAQRCRMPQESTAKLDDEDAFAASHAGYAPTPCAFIHANNSIIAAALSWHSWYSASQSES